MKQEKTAEVIIIGAGIIGISIAWHLAKSGCPDVLVLEKEETIGSGSTAKAAGGVRHQFRNDVNVRLSVEGIKAFERFEDEIGVPVDFHRCGYMFLACTEQELEDLHRRVSLQQKYGVESFLLSPGEAAKIVPTLDFEGVLGAAYGPTDGRVDPHSVTQGYASAARGLGVKIRTGVEVLDIITKDGQVRGISTPEGKIEAPVLVNAAGPYAGLVGKTAGLDIPVKPIRKHTFYTAPSDEIRKGAPFTVDLHRDVTVWKESRGIAFNGNDPEQEEGFDTTVDWSCLDKIARRAVPRFPFLADLGIMRADAGLHPDTVDRSAILGDIPGLKGLYLACGFNSQGIMHAPAVGRIIAEYILGISCDSAIESLRLSRFKEGMLQEEGLVPSQ